MTPSSEEPYPRLVNRRLVHEGRVITVYADDVAINEQLTVRRDVVQHSGAVVILALDEAGRILWIRQPRWAAGRELLELPAGTLEDGEDIEACARRELIEETGFAASDWQPLGGFFSAPGFCSEYLHAFAATGLTPEQADGDEDEEITLQPLTLDETLACIDAGQVEDAKSLATFLLYLRKQGP